MQRGTKRDRDNEDGNPKYSKARRISLIEQSNSTPRFPVDRLPSIGRTTDHYKNLGALTEGTYFVWLLLSDKEDQQQYAARKMELGDKPAEMDLRYINISLALSHRHLVHVREIIVHAQNQNKVWLITELCDFSLHDMMHPRLEEATFEMCHIKTVMLQLLSAVVHMHSEHVMHRDIKPSKIMFKDGEVRLCLSRLLREYNNNGGTSPNVVTLWYRPPELLLGIKEYSFAIDMWSIGCIMGELICQRPLFAGNSEVDQLSKIVNLLGPIKRYEWPELPALTAVSSVLFTAPQPQVPLVSLMPGLSRAGIELLMGLLSYNPNTRLTASQAWQHPWFTEPPLPQDLKPLLHDYKAKQRKLWYHRRK